MIPQNANFCTPLPPAPPVRDGEELAILVLLVRLEEWAEHFAAHGQDAAAQFMESARIEAGIAATEAGFFRDDTCA